MRVDKKAEAGEISFVVIERPAAAACGRPTRWCATCIAAQRRLRRDAGAIRLRPRRARGRPRPEAAGADARPTSSATATASCIHTAFRRLVYKTQVFLNHEGDLFRTRLTHSLEVAQLARSVARRSALNEDLVEAIALAHDSGHTPFGHAGQDALHELHGAAIGGFEHNFQSLRVVDRSRSATGPSTA
jgi:hypothetical protein